MAAPDPVDVRLLALVAELGRAAVHDIGARLGMDPREVASRLVTLSASGLPLIVGVECDPNGLRSAIAGANTRMGYPSGPYQVPGTPAGPYYPPPPQQRGPVGAPAGYRAPGGGQPAPARPAGPVRSDVPSGPLPAAGVPAAVPGADPISTWGPPQTASWARGDQPTRPANPAPAGGRNGKVGDTLQTEGLDGEQIAIQLVEVVDPADFLFTAAGYRLRDGERAVVVHTELTNRGSIPFPTLPDLYLVLVDAEGKSIGKAPVSLSSRPPHRIGVPPGETAGGHTVYVISDSTRITSVRWSARPDDDKHVVTWTIDD